jgi:predicted DNA-binding transcriptional regulator AlpA
MPTDALRTTATTLLTAAEAAEMLRMTERGLADWRYRGIGPLHVRLTGRGVRYRLADVEDFIESRLRTSTSDDGRAA